MIIMQSCPVMVKFDLLCLKRRKSVLDSTAIACLVEILKTSTPNLQKKAASILEFIAITDPTMDVVISVDIESALDALFQQKVLIGKGTFCSVKTSFVNCLFIYAVLPTFF